MVLDPGLFPSSQRREKPSPFVSFVTFCEFYFGVRVEFVRAHLDTATNPAAVRKAL